MSGPHRVEPVAKALRRQAQLQRWSCQRDRHARSGARTTLAHTKERNGTDTPAATATSLSQEASASTVQSRGTAAPSPAAAPHASRSLASSQTLQHAYRHRDTAQLSVLQRRLADVLDTSTSKAEAAEAFFSVARSDQEALTPATLTHFTTAVLRHTVAAQMGSAAYAAALNDAVGVTEGRWSQVEPAEARAFALYQATRIERYAVKGTSYEARLGLTLEGGDNALVALTHFQLQKHAARALPVGLDVLEELMHLDVSWSSALKVYDYAKELAGVAPPAGMTARLMGLMTGYKTNGLGSRPWKAALQLYDGLLRSGYDVPLDAHTAALDAVWRSGDAFVRPHRTPSAAAQAEMWATLVRVRDNVDDAAVTGEAGCRFSEALVKAASAAGKWEAAVQVLQNMDLAVADTSARLLVPTAETLLFAMAACNVVHNAAHATALLQTFNGLYTLRSAHPEALAAYLQSLRHVDHLASHIGAQVEGLVKDGFGLDRPCCVACLQLLSSQRVRTAEEKWRLAQLLVRTYDSNPWPQQPQARQAELQTVFRCCHLIAALHGGSRAVACPLLPELQAHLVAVFGADSPECRWLRDTEVYTLLTTESWRHALDVYERQVEARAPADMADLPIPLRQLRRMLAQALVKAGRAADEPDAQFLLDEDRQEQEKASLRDYLAFAVNTVRDVYARSSDTAPRGLTGELLLLQALHTTQTAERQRLAVEAMRELACGEAAAVTPRVIDLVSQALSLTVEHVEGVLVEGSAQLRGKALESSDRHLGLRAPSLERVHL